MSKLIKFFEIRAEVLVPKFTRAEVRLPACYSVIQTLLQIVTNNYFDLYDTILQYYECEFLQ